MTLVALLTDGFAKTEGCAMVSGGAVGTQTFVKENLFAISDMCHSCTFDGFVIFAAVNVRPTAGFTIGAPTRVVNSCLLAYVTFC